MAAFLGLSVLVGGSIFAGKWLLAGKKEQGPPVFVLKNDNGMEAHISPAGAAIIKLIVPDSHGKKQDVVLGFKSSAAYLGADTPYFGVVVGRVANRIKEGRFQVDGREYQLATNNGPNSLHGGVVGWDKKVWEVAAASETSLTLKLSSPDGDEGYPGAVEAIVTYTLSEDDKLTVDMRATTTAATPLSMAQHSYFNLAGHGSGDILNHKLMVVAEHITPVDGTQIPTGEYAPVQNGPFDFRIMRRVGERLSEVPGGYDHNYVLHGMGAQSRFIVKDGMASATPKLAARLYDPSSGRRMDVLTTAPGVQLYTGNFLTGVHGKGGAVYGKHAGLCLETQAFPNSINEPAFPSVLLQPEQEYHHVVAYAFGSED